MATSRTNASADKSSVRTTVTLPKGDYAEIGRLAQRKKVSVAWIVRDAVEKYLSGRKSPLR